MKKLLALGRTLAGSLVLAIAPTALLGNSPALAQTGDPSCYYQDASGRVHDLGNLCGSQRPVAPPSATPNPATPPSNRPSPTSTPRSTPPAPTANRAAECRRFSNLVQQNPVEGQMVPYPATPADRQQNVEIADALQQMAGAIAALSFQDPILQGLQDMAVQMHQGGRSLALAYNQTGPSPTQNQGYALDSTAMGIVITAGTLVTSFQETCGYSLF